MKKLFFFATAAVVLASCNNDVTISENVALEGSNAQKEIAFTPYAQMPKRVAAQSGAIEGTGFPTTLDMTVAAWEQGATGKDFFSPTVFVYKSVGGSVDEGNAAYWGGQTPRYWPFYEAYLNFLAIANANVDDAATDITWGTGTAAFASKVVVVQADNYDYDDNQRDFMYAIGNGQVTKTGSAYNFVNNGIVNMTFKHAQAYLVFNLKAADAASTAIKIKNIEIYGAHFAGTATINHTAYNAQTGQGTTLYWSPVTQTNEYKSILADQTAKADEVASVALSNAAFTQMGQIIIVPKMSAADTYADNGETKIKISYYLGGELYTFEYELTNDTYEAGKKYVYNITFKLHEIFVNPEVEDWKDGGTTFVDVPTMAYAAGASAGSYTVDATARTYIIYVAGLGNTDAVSATETGGNDYIDGDITATNTNGTVKLVFKMKANDSSARSTTITLSNTTASTTTTITINQAAPVVP